MCGQWHLYSLFSGGGSDVFCLWHSAVHVVLVIFVFLVYTSSEKLGSPQEVYAKLASVVHDTHCSEPLNWHNQACGPVSGNNGGSYLTMLSTGGLVFGIINIVGNFGTVFVDNVSKCPLRDRFLLGCPFAETMLRMYRATG